MLHARWIKKIPPADLLHSLSPPPLHYTSPFLIVCLIRYIAGRFSSPLLSLSSTSTPMHAHTHTRTHIHDSSSSCFPLKHNNKMCYIKQTSPPRTTMHGINQNSHHSGFPSSRRPPRTILPSSLRRRTTALRRL